MSKKRKQGQQQKKGRRTSKSGTPITLDEMLDTEPLTDDLIKELVAEGWPKDDLEHAREIGMRYSRKRHSLLTNPEGSGIFKDLFD